MAQTHMLLPKAVGADTESKTHLSMKIEGVVLESSDPAFLAGFLQVGVELTYSNSEHRKTQFLSCLQRLKQGEQTLEVIGCAAGLLAAEQELNAAFRRGRKEREEREEQAKNLLVGVGQ